jgi:hypothetical protein
MDDIMGVHDVSRGQAPVNAPDSGYGLSILAEQDTTPVGKLVKGSAIAWGKVASMCLELFQAEVKGPRQAVVRTPSQPPETMGWTGHDLMRQTQATVPLEAVIPRSHAALQAMAEKMVQMGLIKSFEQFATIMELPGTADLVNRLSPDVAKARWENHAMAQGQVCVPDDFDDHAVHLEQLNDFRKSAKYRLLDPEVQQTIAEHAQAHETMAAEEMGKAQARAAISPALAAAPTAHGGVVLPPDALPPGGGTGAGIMPMETPGDGAAPPTEDGAPVEAGPTPAG